MNEALEIAEMRCALKDKQDELDRAKMSMREAHDRIKMLTDDMSRCDHHRQGCKEQALAAQVHAMRESYSERVAQLAAHRACCGVEHDPQNGKLHGCCVVCGVPWPCEYAGAATAAERRVAAMHRVVELAERGKCRNDSDGEMSHALAALGQAEDGHDVDCACSGDSVEHADDCGNCDCGFDKKARRA